MNRASRRLGYVAYMYRRVAELHDLVRTRFGRDVGQLRVHRALTNVAEVLEATPLSRSLYVLVRLSALSKKIDELRREAERQTLYERYVETEESVEIRGPVLWGLAAASMARGGALPQTVLVRDVRSPENLLLLVSTRCAQEILDEAERAVDKRLDVLFRHLRGQSGGSPILDQAKRALGREADFARSHLEKALKSPLFARPTISEEDSWRMASKLSSEIRRRPWRPRWVDELLTVTGELEAFRKAREELGAAIEDRGVDNRRADGLFLRYLSWRLYEVYVFSLLLEALTGLGMWITRSNGYIEVRIGGRRVLIYTNRPLETSAIGKSMIEVVDGGPAGLDPHRYRGRPDIGAQEPAGRTALLLVEAKFSWSPTYLAYSKFKAVAYAYEYSPRAVALAFPEPPKETITKRLDSEIAEHAELLRRAYELEGLKLKLRNGSKLYLLPITPTQKHEKYNVQALANTIREALEPMEA